MDPIKLALAVGIASAFIILALCFGCAGLIAVGNASQPTPTVEGTP